jgi:hypothetical protein
MKKFLVFILVCAAGYFAYEYLIKEKPVLEIKADKVISVDNSMDIEAPVLYPPKYGSIQGTVKNITDRVLNNVVLKYQLDTHPVEAAIGSLEPGELRKFSTQTVMVRGNGVPFFLEEMKYE